MKRLPAGVLLAVAALLISVRYLSKESQRSPAQHGLDPNTQFQSQRLATMLEDEERTLLATKHGLTVEAVQGILADYDSAFFGVAFLEPGKEGSLVFPEATNTNQVIEAISKKHGVPPTVLASLLIDQKLMQERSDE